MDFGPENLEEMAYSDGFDAFEMDIPLSANPYSAVEDLKLQEAWIAGYWRAEYEATTYFDWDRGTETADYDDEVVE